MRWRTLSTSDKRACKLMTWRVMESIGKQIKQWHYNLCVLASKSLIKHREGSKSTSNLFLISSGRPFKSLGKRKGWKHLLACPVATCFPAKTMQNKEMKNNVKLVSLFSTYYFHGFLTSNHFIPRIYVSYSLVNLFLIPNGMLICILYYIT